MLLLVGSVVTTVVFVIVAYQRHKLHHRNQETQEGNVVMFDICVVDMLLFDHNMIM